MSRRARPSEQRAILAAALARARVGAPRGVAVFDLDSTLLDNRPRHARILRDYGRAAGLAVLAGAEPGQVDGWDLEASLRKAGLARWIARARAAEFRAFWEARFFTSAYCRLDVPVPGAPAFVNAAREAGARIAYVTARPQVMEPGTRDVLARFAFPEPGTPGVTLLMKPGTGLRDDAWKALACDAVNELGPVVLAFDNEPAHVNGYHRAWPGALTIHLDTGHSGRPIEVDAAIPSVADLRLDLPLSAAAADARA